MRGKGERERESEKWREGAKNLKLTKLLGGFRRETAVTVQAGCPCFPAVGRDPQLTERLLAHSFSSRWISEHTKKKKRTEKIDRKIDVSQVSSYSLFTHLIY